MTKPSSSIILAMIGAVFSIMFYHHKKIHVIRIARISDIAFSHKPISLLSSVIQTIFDIAGEQALPCGNFPFNVHKLVSIVAAKLL